MSLKAAHLLRATGSGPQGRFAPLSACTCRVTLSLARAFFETRLRSLPRNCPLPLGVGDAACLSSCRPSRKFGHRRAGR